MQDLSTNWCEDFDTQLPILYIFWDGGNLKIDL
jgi:hypothetical protein